MTIINELPNELFNYINEFTSINNLIKTCKFFYQFKKNLYYWKLTIEYSKKFYYNIENFREKINLLITDSNKQLSINFCFRLRYIHKLNLSACSNITYVSMLGNVHILNLSACYDINDEPLDLD